MMTKEEILHEMDRLTPAERMFVLRHLCEASLTGYCSKARRQGIDETFAMYRQAMLKATGADPLERTRKPHAVWARNIIVFEMMKDGYVHTEIAKRVGLSHCQLPYCRESMLSMLELPQYYKQEMDMYNKFKEALK